MKTALVGDGSATQDSFMSRARARVRSDKVEDTAGKWVTCRGGRASDRMANRGLSEIPETSGSRSWGGPHSLED